MPKRILIVPDSFKESLSSISVALAIKEGIQKVFPDSFFDIVPMADGGEGTVDAIIHATGGAIYHAEVNDPRMRRVDAKFGITGDHEWGVIEMAEASGLERLRPVDRNPWITTTYGTGEIIKAAMEKGCKKLIVGIGGSATNDGGVGMAQALGVRFLDVKGEPIGRGGGELSALHSIDLSYRVKDLPIIQVACDVGNPLTGPYGASYTYGPQKGADPDMVKKLDDNLIHFARIIREQLGTEVEKVPGAGAAGGLGAGLMAFCNAKLIKGFDIVSEIVHLEERIKNADLVITGEGRMDDQTKCGKTPFGIAQIAAHHHKPVIAVAGTLGRGYEELYSMGFGLILPILNRPISLDEALLHARDLLVDTGQRIGRIIALSPSL